MLAFVVGIIYVGNRVVTSRSLEPPSIARNWYPATQMELGSVSPGQKLARSFGQSLAQRFRTFYKRSSSRKPSHAAAHCPSN
jgi:hypothetical protein